MANPDVGQQDIQSRAYPLFCGLVSRLELQRKCFFSHFLDNFIFVFAKIRYFPICKYKIKSWFNFGDTFFGPNSNPDEPVLARYLNLSCLWRIFSPVKCKIYHVSHFSLSMRVSAFISLALVVVLVLHTVLNDIRLNMSNLPSIYTDHSYTLNIYT